LLCKVFTTWELCKISADRKYNQTRSVLYHHSLFRYGVVIWQNSVGNKINKTSAFFH
jgi:uncharacterized protein (DUF2225 family)